MWKYLRAVVAALVLTAGALYLYGQPLGLASWHHYAVVAGIALAVTWLGEHYLKGWVPWIVSGASVLLGYWVQNETNVSRAGTWLTYVGVAILAVLLATWLTALFAPSARNKSAARH